MLKSTETKKHLYFRALFTLLPFIVAMVIIVSIFEFYRSTVQNTLTDLQAIVDTRANVIKEIYFETKNLEATLNILKRSHGQNLQSDKLWSFTLSTTKNNRLHMYIWSSKSSQTEEKIITLDKKFDDPVKYALNEKRGVYQGQDFRDKRILAAYSYIQPLNMRLVGRLDLWHIQKLFLILTSKLLGLGALLSLGGIYTFRYFERQKNKSESMHKKRLEDALDALDSYKQGMDKHSMLCLTNDKGQILEANKRFCDNTGYSSKELLGNDFSILKSGEHDQKFYKNLWTTIKSKNVWHGQIKNKRKDNSFFWVDTTIVPIRRKDQLKKDFFMSIQSEITEKKLYEEELIEAKSSAELASQRKSSFLAHMSHEIRTPLAAIIGYIDLVENDSLLQPSSKKYIQTIKRNSKHLQTLTGEILDFSKIESGELEIKKTSTPLLPEIKLLEELFDKRSANIKFSIELYPPLPETIYTDLLRFKQVLINIIGNAFKYTDKGKIIVRIRLSNSNTGEMSDKLAIEVEDTGIGIKQENFRDIFKPFIQTNTFYTRKEAGTGLGLPLAKNLARLLGGDVLLLKSTPEKGSTFIIFIDFGGSNRVNLIHDVPQIERGIEFENGNTNKGKDRIEIGAKNNHHKKVNILLIEDSYDISELVRINLELAGHNIKIFADGELGIQELRDKSYDIILLDIQLPNKSGHDLIKEIRKIRPKIPVIALTAHSTKAEKAACMRSGFNEFLTKPINFDQLLKVINHWFNLGQKVYEDCNLMAPDKPLYSAFSDDRRIKKQLQSFTSSMPEKINICRELVRQKNWNDLRKYCHKIKGAYGTYGYPEMQVTADQIESYCFADLNDIQKEAEISSLLGHLELLFLRAEFVFSQ